MEISLTVGLASALRVKYKDDAMFIPKHICPVNLAESQISV
jgi:hypothetical protein